jgi:hypothetical protein
MCIPFAQFVYALSRDGGFEFFVSQYSNHQVFFTSLLEYKTHGENARSLVTLTNYIDLLKVCPVQSILFKSQRLDAIVLIAAMSI